MKSLLRHREARFDLDGLCAAAADALRGVRAEDARTSDTPDPRLVRYYQSLGLVDRPLAYEGRSARYGYRHLLQLFAVKSAQAAGASLAQIQRALPGLTTTELEAAALEETALEETGVETVAAAPQPVRHRALVTVELAPGVLVTLDPEIVDAERVLASLTSAFFGGRP